MKSSVPAEPVGLGVKGSDDGSLASWLLPIALVLGGLLLFGGPIAYAVGTSGGGTSFFRRRSPAAAAGAGFAGAVPAEAPAAEGSTAGETPEAGGAESGSAGGGTDD